MSVMNFGLSGLQRWLREGISGIALFNLLLDVGIDHRKGLAAARSP